MFHPSGDTWRCRLLQEVKVTRVVRFQRNVVENLPELKLASDPDRDRFWTGVHCLLLESKTHSKDSLINSQSKLNKYSLLQINQSNLNMIIYVKFAEAERNSRLRVTVAAPEEREACGGSAGRSEPTWFCSARPGVTCLSESQRSPR